MCEIPSGYFEIQREAGETRGAFIRRAWRTANPTLPADLRGVAPETLQSEVVRDGYESPYCFGRELRRRADADYGPVWAAYHACEVGTHAIYYVFAGCERVDGGPTRAAFYNPSR